MEPQPTPLETSTPWLSPRRLKLAIGAVVVLLVGVFAYLIISEIAETRANKRWDDWAQIQHKYEAGPLSSQDTDTRRKGRDAYIEELEAFIVEKAEKVEDALAPHAHWQVAMLCADQLVDSPGLLDMEKRRSYHERAIRHMEAVRDDYPDHPINWSIFAPEGHANITRMFLEQLRANADWEEKYFPRSRDPAADPVVVVRTDRGDLRMTLYLDDAPELTALFLKRARAGEYDGTAFFMRTRETDSMGKPTEATVRGGHPVSRDAIAYKPDSLVATTEPEDAPNLLPALSRNQIPHTRGIVTAWHGDADPYDGELTFAIVVSDSPVLDHAYSPLGLLLDDASLAVADQIYDAETWQSDPVVSLEGGAFRSLMSHFQVPTRIVKVLVFENGALLDPDGDPVPTKVEADESEKRLDTLSADAYRADPPERPAPPVVEDEEDAADAEDTDPEDTDPDNGADEPEAPETPEEE